MSFQDPTEEFVFNLCRRSFLSQWSYANPRRHRGNGELCDILIICEPDTVIYSVKNYQYNTGLQSSIAVPRWLKKAVENSVRQIYGAERDLASAAHVIRSDGTEGLALPPVSERRIHRVSVSLGGRGAVPVPSGDFGKGFVHVFDEEAMFVVMRELDTVTDFIRYLDAKETLATTQPGLVVEGGEKNLLAIYLHNGHLFPETELPRSISGDNWVSFVQQPAYVQWQDIKKDSYLWDHLIEYLSKEILQGRTEFGSTLSQSEHVLRYLAREPRFERRRLSKALLEFWDLAREQNVRARMCRSGSGVGYVFFNPSGEPDRKARVAELGCRCFIARDRLPDCKVVVGFGANLQRAPKGYAEDLILFASPEWSEEQAKQAEEMRRDLGFFKDID